MIRDITLGQYYPVDSVIHRMDPRTKLFGTMVFIISLFLSDNIVTYVIATLFLVMCIRLSKVPFSFMVRGLKAIVFLLLISVSFNLFLTDGKVLFQIGFLKITQEGIATACFMSASDVSGDRLIRDDTDNDTKPVDRWIGEEPWIFKCCSCAGS